MGALGGRGYQRKRDAPMANGKAHAEPSKKMRGTDGSRGDGSGGSAGKQPPTSSSPCPDSSLVSGLDSFSAWVPGPGRPGCQVCSRARLARWHWRLLRFQQTLTAADAEGGGASEKHT